MRIAHIVSTYPPYAGGMGNTCFYEVKELQKAGHEVIVFTPKYTDGVIPSEVKQAVELKIIFLKPLFSVGNAAFVPQIIKKLKDFDIVHLHWPFIGGAEVVLFFKLFTHFKPKLVIQYHMDLIGFGLRAPLFYIYNCLFNSILIRSADAILVSSFDYIRNSNIKKYISRYNNKFIEFSLGVDDNQFSPKPKDIRLLEKYNFSADDRIVLFVGGLDRAHYFKGLEVLLRAIVRMKDKIKLLIVGEGELKQKYKRMARELKIDDRVIFAGRVGNKDLPQYYNLADVFVLPSISRSEAFGLVFLEAMACAKPIVVSDLPGPRTLVKNNGLIVKVNDSHDLSRKLILILNNQPMAQKFGKQGRRLAKEKYSWKRAGERLNEIYHDIVNT
ncbi:glycosyltransferase family 4 protein [Patescibacteria group bacterium AH-259-L07]|nr:glycosyltransferase family 4 protein [Patescibacteria group bacterium AH-259-L07]